LDSFYVFHHKNPKNSQTIFQDVSAKIVVDVCATHFVLRRVVIRVHAMIVVTTVIPMTLIVNLDISEEGEEDKFSIHMQRLIIG
jgi:hypothetical protein